MSIDLDLRDRWAGIRRLKSNYTPKPYFQTNEDGTTVKYHEQAEGSAKYLTNLLWKKSEIEHNLKIEKYTIRKLKSNKVKSQ